MRVLLYFENHRSIAKSGIGTAMQHQTQALLSAGVEITYDPFDDYDIAHINTYLPKSKDVLLMCKAKKIPVIVHGHSTIEDFKNSFRLWRFIALFYDPNLKWFYRHADHIIAPTEYSKRLISSYGITCKIDAISNGVDLSKYAPNPEAVSQFKKAFCVQNEKIMIGVGLPMNRKGIADFVEVARSLPQYRFIWFGYLHPILEEDDVIKLQNNLPKNCEMPGYFNNNLLKGAYQYASAMLFTSYEETEGIVVLEALASGCPVILRDIDVYNPRMKDRINCYKGHNNKEFADLVKEVAENPQDKIIKCGLETVKDIDLPIIGQKLKKVYEEVLEDYSKKE